MSASLETWDYTFGERAPDFMLTIRAQTTERVFQCEVRFGGPRWVWTILCAMRWGYIEKPAIALAGEAETKAEAIDEPRAAWAIEREWRREFREMTAVTHGCWRPVALAAAWWSREAESLRGQ